MFEYRRAARASGRILTRLTCTWLLTLGHRYRHGPDGQGVRDQRKKSRRMRLFHLSIRVHTVARRVYSYELSFKINMAASAANRNRQSQTPAADPQKRLPCFACSLQIKKNLWNICQVSAYWKQPPGKSPAQKSPLPWFVDMKKSANTTCCQTQKNNAFPHQSCALCAARYRACHLHSSKPGRAPCALVVLMR